MDGLVASLAVIGYRFLVPFLILRYPLAGIFLAIAADASDAMIFEATGWGLFGGGANYSYWDKALDIWFLFSLDGCQKAASWLGTDLETVGSYYLHRGYPQNRPGDGDALAV